MPEPDQHRRPPADTPLRVGIAGLGRSGWNIHAKTLATHPDRFRIAAVADGEATRRDEAVRAFGCAAYDTTEALIAHRDLDVLVVATPNLLHGQHTIAALRAGLHVVAEKPMATDIAEADAMIATAQEFGRVLAPFQNRRCEPHYLKVCELIRTGVLGRVVQVRMCWHQFTRRWDWQVVRAHGGGLLTVNGTHLIDQAMQLLAPGEFDVWCDLQRALSCGDAEDHVKVLLRGDGPTIDIELTNACAYPQDRWLVMGTHGSLRGTPERLTWQTVDWSRMPRRELETGVAAAGRAYPREDIAWVTHRWEQPADAPHPYDVFYDNLHAALTRNESLLITPDSVRRTIDAVRRCYDAAPAPLRGPANESNEAPPARPTPAPRAGRPMPRRVSTAPK